MERESFEDSEVAEILNSGFISVKVDREERPDIDSIYMSVCQMLTGGGGWPLSVFMSADKKPFYAGTYFPKQDRGRFIGLVSLLTQITELWDNNRDKLTGASEQILSELKKDSKTNPGKLDASIINKTVKYFSEHFDPIYGGFGSAPKFPSAHNLLFLIRVFYAAENCMAPIQFTKQENRETKQRSRYCSATQNSEILDMVEKTLIGMYRGGMYDHIGFGFSRYSTDDKWLAPHFEKMLYDNALLSMAFTEVFHFTGKKEYAKTAKEIFEYIKRDMTSADGTFYSAEDADSEGVEGKFYVWKPGEIIRVLGEEDGSRFCDIFDITEKGNFEGNNIPNLIGKNLNAEDTVFGESCRQKLFEHREKRVHPFKDTKIIVSWNGLMIASLSIAGRVMENTEYTKLAEKCAVYIYRKLLQTKNLFADDYAFFTWGLIELYETTFNENFLEWAIELTEILTTNFWDKASAGLFLYGSKSEQLIIRPKEIYDGATPSANSVFAYNLLRLARLTGRQAYEEQAQKLLEHFAGHIKNMPSAHSFSLISFLYLNTKSAEIVLAAESGEQAADMISVIRKSKNPFTVCLLKTPEHVNLASLAEFASSHKAIDGKCTAYACEGASCHAPVTDAEKLKELLYI